MKETGANFSGALRSGFEEEKWGESAGVSVWNGGSGNRARCDKGRGEVGILGMKK